ncbi:MAG: SH3 domain-containing protein [Gammaproteobacteria bacterium]
MRQLLLIAALGFVSLVTPAYGKASHYEAVVAEPYLELHTGPGRGFPVFHVVDRGQQIQILKRRTDWFKVRTDRDVEGWVKLAEIEQTLDTAGKPIELDDPTADDYMGRRWELALALGDLDGASVISVNGAYRWTRNISTELQFADISGTFSDGWLTTIAITIQPFPEWKVSPYAALGTGMIHVQPKATLVSTEDRTDQIGQVGLGLRMYLSKRFLLRAEYNSYLTFTSRDDNEELDEWKAGFAFFF